jgi:aminopeptidase N
MRGRDTPRSPRLRTLVTAVLAAAMVVSAATPAGAGTSTIGGEGIGDPYFPRAGNGGYDVRHYHLNVRYEPSTGRLEGIARITLVPLMDLTRFDFDLVGLHVERVRVAASPATWTRRDRHELVVTPSHLLPAGHAVDAVVRYGGVPVMFRIPGTPLRTGVVPTDDGADIWGEPQVAAAWFPVNDHPRDKASYDIDLTVPNDVQAVSNGRLAGRTTHGGRTTWRWIERRPMASYLALAAIGRFDLRFRRTPGGLPVIDAVDPDAGDAADFALGQEVHIVRFLSSRFGPYPFDALGGVVDDANLGAALENQTRPLYPSDFFRRNGSTSIVVHELAHQWFGDSVSVDLWRYTWLNEGFATYAEWMWSQATGKGSAAAIAAAYCRIPASDPFWDLRIGEPGVARIFDPPIYYRGALTLQALRRRVGVHDFFRILRAWAYGRAGSTGTTDQFESLAEHVSGRPLDRLFTAWLDTPARPAHCAGGHTTPARSPPPVPTPNGLLRLDPPR